MQDQKEVQDLINGIGDQMESTYFGNDVDDSEEAPIIEDTQIETSAEETSEGEEAEKEESQEEPSESDSEEIGSIEIDGVVYESDKVAEALELLNSDSNLSKRVEWLKGLDDEAFDEASNQFIATKVATEKYKQASELKQEAESLINGFKEIQEKIDLNEFLTTEFIENNPRESEAFKKAISIIESHKADTKLQENMLGKYMLQTTLNVVRDKVPEYKHMNLADFSKAYNDVNHPDHINVKIISDLLEKSSDAYDVASKLNTHFGKNRKQEKAPESAPKKSIKYVNTKGTKAKQKEVSPIEQMLANTINNNKDKTGAKAYWG